MKDDIENIYSQLKDYSKEPPQELWDHIEAKLHPKKKQRGLIWFFGTAAAVLVLLLGYQLIDFNKTTIAPTETISDVEHNDRPKIKESGSDEIKRDAEGVIAEKNDLLVNDEPNPSEVTVKKQPLNKKAIEHHKTNLKNQYKLKEKNNAPNYNKGLVENGINTEKLKSQDDTKDIITHQQKKDLTASENTLSVAENTDVSDEDPQVDIAEIALVNNTTEDSLNVDTINKSKWSVAVLGGLANTVAESRIQGSEVNTNPQNDFVYTLRVGYDVSEKLTLKSGIGKNILGQEISGINYASADSPLAGSVSQDIVDNSSILFFGGSESNADLASVNEFSSRGVLEQRFDYIQVPLEVSYRFIEHDKYNMSFGVGGNINFLTNNSAFLNDEDIGENIGVNNTVFGATINSSISFKFTKETLLFFEPSYNYFQSPVDNSGQNFTNAQLRVLFGLRYRF